MDFLNKGNIKIYNSIKSKKELFKPINSNYVGIYICGPTVYNKIHLGNCRTFIFFDIVYRYLKLIGYKVRYIRNITDVGHLEDNGEDKISKKAILEKIEPMEIAQKYTLHFHDILSKFNVLPPNIEPIATGHIIEQIEFVKKLIKYKFAYEINGSVYFNIKLYNKKYDYGILSNRKVDNLIFGTRLLEKQTEKINLSDFVVWKNKNNSHIMNWPSPWGYGFPGWHLECTVMSTKYLGSFFDIHGGGMDLKFPHHECEIAQCQSIYGTKMARYWMHVNMLNLNNFKMSKSLNNVIFPDEILNEEKYNNDLHYNILKFSVLQSHYRNVLNFSKNSIKSAKKNYIKLLESINRLDSITFKSNNSDFDIISWEKECYHSMNNDFNIPLLIFKLLKGSYYINEVYNNKAKLNEYDLNILKKTMKIFFFKILGFNVNNKYYFNKEKYPTKLINLILLIRNKMRYENRWELSDYIRDELNKIGIQIEDNKIDTIFKIKY